MSLNNVKLLLGITGTDRDSLLNLLIGTISSRLCLLIGQNTVPDVLEYIVEEVTVRRYNQLSSEGFRNHSIEGESIEIRDNIFEEYKDDIKAWLSAQEESGVGRIKFL